jgi:chaperonin cofactor prefoldin
MTGFNPHREIELPLESILSSGADSRSQIDSETGLNKYLCSLSPVDDVVSFGSCTASSVSAAGYHAMREMHQRFLAVGSGEALERAIAENNENVRREVVSLLTLGLLPGVELALTPSGTDAELLALSLAAGPGKRPIRNILIGPTEIGRGSPNAASCLHFDHTMPCNRQAVVGEPVDQELADRTELCKIPIRTPSGDVRDIAEIDQEVKDHIETAIAQGKKVLLHVIAHSKTGVHAPSLELIEMMQDKHGEHLFIVVDAAQGRFSRRGLLKALKCGYLVIITGSKFYGGAFFSGGLLIPPQLHPARVGLEKLPPGFASYFTRDDLPHSWVKIRNSMPPTSNLGLSLRWTAAVAEVRNYYLTPSNLRLIVLRAFEDILPKVFGSSSWIQLMPGASRISDDNADRFLQSKTTVFSFALKKSEHEGSLLNFQQLGDVFKWLNSDISSFLPTATPEIRRSLAPRHHIGQPVLIGSAGASGRSILRVAIGSVLIARIAADVRYGSTLEDRINWLEDQLISLKRKIETVTSRFDEIKRAERTAEVAA